MPVRAMWKGSIRLGDDHVPVKLYAGIEDRGVHFRLLHETDGTPVRQRMVDPTTGRVIAADRVRRGHPVGGDTYVLISDAEIDELQPRASRDIRVLRFLPAGTIDAAWYDRPYLVGPDTGADEAYFALAEAMHKRDVEAVVRWVMRKKRYVGAMRLHGKHLAIMSLHHAGEVVPASALEPPAVRKPTDREVALARQLIEALEDDFDATAFTDEYSDRVRELIEAKASGGTVSPPAEEQLPSGRLSLAQALEASVRSTNGRSARERPTKSRVAKRGAAKKRPARRGATNERAARRKKVA